MGRTHRGAAAALAIAAAAWLGAAPARGDVAPSDTHDCEDAPLGAACLSDACERGTCTSIGKQCKQVPEGCPECQLPGGPPCPESGCRSTAVECAACLVPKDGQLASSTSFERWEGCADKAQGAPCKTTACEEGTCEWREGTDGIPDFLCTPSSSVASDAGPAAAGIALVVVAGAAAIAIHRRRRGTAATPAIAFPLIGASDSRPDGPADGADLQTKDT